MSARFFGNLKIKTVRFCDGNLKYEKQAELKLGAKKICLSRLWKIYYILKMKQLLRSSNTKSSHELSILESHKK